MTHNLVLLALYACDKCDIIVIQPMETTLVSTMYTIQPQVRYKERTILTG